MLAGTLDLDPMVYSLRWLPANLATVFFSRESSLEFVGCIFQENSLTRILGSGTSVITSFIDMQLVVRNSIFRYNNLSASVYASCVPATDQDSYNYPSRGMDHRH